MTDDFKKELGDFVKSLLLANIESIAEFVIKSGIEDQGAAIFKGCETLINSLFVSTLSFFIPEEDRDKVATEMLAMMKDFSVVYFEAIERGEHVEH
ncbi:MAG: hypothetical protein FGM16_09220 [Flavobacterium sp.]|nr:hypothetical protein [Flavobacterium sp.]